MRILHCLALAAVIGATVACSQPAADTVKTESKTKVQTPEGTKTTELSSQQTGSTLTAESKSTLKTPDGTTETAAQTVVGTVSAYQAGKKIEVLTGDSSKHAFDLDEAKVSYNIDAGVTVGSKVRLVQRTDEKGQKVIEVRLQLM